MKYLLDTVHISFIQRRSGSKHAKLTARITQHPAKDLYQVRLIGYKKSLRAQRSGAKQPQGLWDCFASLAIDN